MICTSLLCYQSYKVDWYSYTIEVQKHRGSIRPNYPYNLYECFYIYHWSISACLVDQ